MISDIIKTRRSVYPDQYIPKPIPREILLEVLEAANWAPTHRKTEPWRFKVLQGESQHRLGQFLKEKYLQTEQRPKNIKIRKLEKNPTKAGAIIAICMQRDPEERIPEWEEIAATAMAVQNMWLTSHSLGIGAYWSSPGLIRYMDEFFEMAEGERCLGFFYMGYYDGALTPRERGAVSEKISWV
ncbi:nitroreductase family protein [Robiginitalea sp. IMCC44478]|uniref:nitroreductase family protein n=1 Tax=Robiginitalea sp. IMCC44478 TaxID=3459122 RepID=UPI004042E281